MNVLTSIVVFSAIFSATGQAHAQPNPHAAMVVIVDGSKNPEKISRQDVSRHFALQFAIHNNASVPEQEHRGSLEASIGIPAADFRALETAFVGVREKLDKLGTNQISIDKVLDSTMSMLKLSPGAVARLDVYMEKNLKPRMRIHGMSQPHGPKFSCNCAFNFVESFDPYVGLYGTMLYNQVNVTDNSNCSHSGYQTTASLNGPGSASSTASGLSALVGIPINVGGTDQTWTASTNGSYFCPCIRSNAGFGGGAQLVLSNKFTYWRFPINFTGVCQYQQMYCISPPTCKSSAGITFSMECPTFAAAGYINLRFGSINTCTFGVLSPAPAARPGGSIASGPGPCT